MARSPNEIWTAKKAMLLGNNFDSDLGSEVRFVTAVIAAGSVNYCASGVNFSKNIFCAFIPKAIEIQ